MLAILQRVQLKPALMTGKIAALTRSDDIPRIVRSPILASLHMLCGTAEGLRCQGRQPMVFRKFDYIADRQPDWKLRSDIRR